jgi:hypothetical protein
MAQHEASLTPPDGDEARAAADWTASLAAPPLANADRDIGAKPDANNPARAGTNSRADGALFPAADPGEQEQIQREIDAIARAIETLRKAEPALEQWTDAPPTALPPRQVWVLIGAVWLSTAVITLGAAIVASSLTG